MTDQEISFRGGRIWFGAQADRYIFEPITTLEAALASQPSISSIGSRVCMRLILNGHPDPFGVLGCKFIPNTQNATTIRVSVAEPGHEQSLKTGLPATYAETILSCAVATLKQRNFLDSGILHFDRAQYHEADSSQRIFKLLTACLLSVLDPQSRTETAVDMETLISSQLYKS